MAKEYIIPPWAGQPPTFNGDDSYSLDVLKNGTIVDTINLIGDKSYFIIGRQVDIVDILAEHPSISRQHAVLQIRDDGALMCLDLNSAQGTFINKETCQHGVYKRLYVGDIFKIGASTRLYIVNGPESQRLPEYDSENLKTYRNKLAIKSAQIKKKIQDEEAEVVTWGFGEDAPQEDDGDNEDETELPSYIKDDKNFDRKFGEKFSADIKDSEVDEKDKNFLDKVRAKEQKIKNMQEENRRIYVKESGQENGLTEGQSAAVSRNDTRIEELKQEIEDLIDQIRTKKTQREGNSQTRGPSDSKVKTLKEENCDDLFDTTQETADVKTNWRLRKKMEKHNKDLSSVTTVSSSIALGYEELSAAEKSQAAKVAELASQIAHEEKIVVDASSNGSDHSKGSGGIGGVIDGGGNVGEEGVDALVQAERAKEAETKLRRLRVVEREAAAELAKLSRLVKAAAPALRSLTSLHRLSAAKPSSDDKAAVMSTPTLADIEHSTLAVVSSGKRTGSGNILVSADNNNSSSFSSSYSSSTLLPTSSSSLSSSAAFEDDSLAYSSASDAVLMDECERIDLVTSSSDPSNSNSGNKINSSSTSSSSSYSSSGMGSSSSSVSAVSVTSVPSSSPGTGKRVRGPELGPGSDTRESLPITGEIEVDLHNGKSYTSAPVQLVSLAAAAAAEESLSKSSSTSSAFTLAAEHQPSKPPATKKKRLLGPSKPATGRNGLDYEAKIDSNVLEGGERVWVPPKNQTGDGRTALNLKLGY